MIQQAKQANINDCLVLIDAMNKINSLQPNTDYGKVFSTMKNFNVLDITPFLNNPQIIKICTSLQNSAYKLFPATTPATPPPSLLELFAKINLKYEDLNGFLQKISSISGNGVILYDFIRIISSPNFEFVYNDYNFTQLSNRIQMDRGIIAGTTNLHNNLKAMNTNWQVYLSLLESIEYMAGKQSDVPGSVKAFADYWNDPKCKSDMATNQDASGLYHKLDAPSHNQLAQMLYLMNFINTQSNKQYFNYDRNKPITDLKIYWTTKKNEQHTIYQIVQHAKLGSTASYYVSSRMVDGFENMANTTFLDSVSNFWTKIKYYLVGREGATQRQPSDDQVLRNFGITDAKGITDLANSMNQYTRGQNLSKTNTDWDNMIKLVNALQDAGVTNITWPQYRGLMSEFCVGKDTNGKDTNNATTWIKVLESMSKLNLRTYPKAESFIKTLVQFNVFYTTNFNDFIAIMKTFQLEKLNNNFDNFNLFVADMMKLGYNYTSNASQVNTIVKYLMMLEMNITQYTKGSLAQNIIMGLFSYSSKTSYYPNALNDVLTYEQLNLNNIQYDGKAATPDILRAIAGLMAVIIQRGEDSFVSPNISDIISFLSPEEFQLIADHAQMPTDIPSFMNSIQIGIQTYNNSLDRATLGIPETISKLNVARMVIQMFPHAMFQFITMEIWSKPKSLSDPNSSYRVAINPDGSAKKAHHRPK